MQRESVIAIGLLRCPASNAGGEDHPYIFTCPMQGTIIEPNDRVYVILPSPPAWADASGTTNGGVAGPAATPAAAHTSTLAAAHKSNRTRTAQLGLSKLASSLSTTRELDDARSQRLWSPRYSSAMPPARRLDRGALVAAMGKASSTSVRHSVRSRASLLRSQGSVAQSSHRASTSQVGGVSHTQTVSETPHCGNARPAIVLRCSNTGIFACRHRHRSQLHESALPTPTAEDLTLSGRGCSPQPSRDEREGEAEAIPSRL